MAETTGIGWTDATMNPWVGCEKVSPGCAHCYAETLVTGRMGRATTWGKDGVRERTSAGNWKKPLAWERYAQAGLLPDGKTSAEGRRPRVFCASLADVFEDRPELDPWRDDLFALIRATPSLDWQILTKRPEYAAFYLKHRILAGDVNGRGAYETFYTDPLPNVWIGVSIENSRHTWRADALRTIPAAVRFISAEPLLGSLIHPGDVVLDEAEGVKVTRDYELLGARRPLDLTGIDWVIVGGESGGRDARPMHPDWAREIRDACLRDNHPVAFYFKQWGSWAPTISAVHGPSDHIFADGQAMVYLGASPKSSGKLLDGYESCEFPDGDRVSVSTL